jgi:hypothetical protein
MNTRRISAGLVLLAACTSSVATSWMQCEQGLWPLDGATNVPLDVTLTISGAGDLDSLPRLSEGVTLETAGGTAVPFTIERGEDNVVRVIPDEPLLANQEYRFAGLDYDALSSTHYQYMGWGSSPSEGAFSTGGERAVLAVTQDSDAVYVVFSEPSGVEDVEILVDGAEIEVSVYDEHILMFASDFGVQAVDSGGEGGNLTIDGVAVDEFDHRGPVYFQGQSSCW